MPGTSEARSPGSRCRNSYDVVISNSRGPETLVALVAELGPRARAATAVDAAKAGDIVVVTVPLKNYRAVPVEPLAGKIVIDTNNYYPQRDGHIAELDNESTTTSELLQAHLPTSKVVKAFNHIYAAALTTDGQPAGTKNRRALVIAGDDQGAKATVTRLLDRVRLRRGGRGAAEGRMAHPARYARLRSASHGGGVAQRPRGGEAVGEPLSHVPAQEFRGHCRESRGGGRQQAQRDRGHRANLSWPVARRRVTKAGFVR